MREGFFLGGGVISVTYQRFRIIRIKRKLLILFKGSLRTFRS